MTATLSGTSLLVGIDFSQGSVQALRRAVVLAEQTRAQLELVHVFEWAGLPDSRDQAESQPAASGAQAWRAVALRAQSVLPKLRRLCARLVADRVPAGIHVLIGDPAASLLQAAERACTPLIVLGAQGQSCLPQRSIGSTAERVCQKSSVPVLLVPAAPQLLSRESDAAPAARPAPHVP